MQRDEILAAIASVPRWRHSIEVAPGIVTPGGTTQRVLRRLGLPADLTGKSVLDVGCSDGFFAFEAEKRGASRVVAFDDWSSPFVDRPDGFRTAHTILGSKVEHTAADLMTLDPTTLGRFDIVLCLGVLYHLRHPLLGLEQLSKLTREVLYLETEVSESILNRPVLSFSEGLYHGRDITTWWVPSISCVQQMARAVGFQRVDLVKIYDTRAVLRCYNDRALLLQDVLGFEHEEIAAIRPDVGQSRSGRAIEQLSWDELRDMQQRLVWRRSSQLAQSRRAIPIIYGAFRRLLSMGWDVLRGLGLRYR